ncbi:MAG: flavodoxin [Proteobacteria bacterium]|nr:flavodoxin [Pseudomonadota bacterium]
MKIAVLSGSPKGDLSVTLQYINFIKKKFPQHEYTVHHLSKRIKTIEKNEAAFQEIVDDVQASDGVLWAVPLYVFLVPSQYKRFIELIRERGAEEAFQGKYAAVVTTSIHFYDHTANNYMHAVCDDLGMKYVDYFSPAMYDLEEEEGRNDLLLFAENFFEVVEEGIPTTRHYPPLVSREFEYVPAEVGNQVAVDDKKILLLTDSSRKGTNLSKMIDRFADSFSSGIEVVDLNDIRIKGGCLGCCECGFDYRCAYTGTDEYIDFYNDKVVSADIVVYAGAVVDRYLSWKWKQFFDRRFFKTHTPTQKDKQIAFIVSGPLSQISNLRQIMVASCDLDRANLVDIVTDEFGDSSEIDALLQDLARRLVKNSHRGYIRPPTFLGVGGRKIFRDDIWGPLRFVFQADHEYYEKHGYYDFPQNDTQSIEYNEKMIEATKDPETREMIRKMIKSQMVESLQKVVDSQ